MTQSIYLGLNNLLAPVGFKRQEATWNRPSGRYVDVLDVQTARSRDLVTVNVGVLHKGVFETWWGEKPNPFVEEPDCTVRDRVPILATGLDKWWDVNDPKTPDAIVQQVAKHGLPFHERMHSAEAMADFLAARRRYPMEEVFLAILRSEVGDIAGAREILQKLQIRKTMTEEWKSRIQDVLGRLPTRTA